jgi:GNAT superfamily N-acetyltransferase
MGEVARLRHEWRVRERGERGLDLADFTAHLREWARENAATHTAFLVERAGRAVGCGWLVVVHRVPSPATGSRRGGMLQAVYVAPEERGAGAGTALVRHMIDEGRRRGFEYLIVHPSERAVSLYRRVGFADADKALELRF